MNLDIPFILASGSPRRRELLASLGIIFTIAKPDIDEAQHEGEDPLAYVRRLSREKAEAVAARTMPPALILAADTTVILDDEILGKPADPAESREMLVRLRNRDHTVCTALTLARLLSGEAPQIQTTHTCTSVWMRDYTDAEIEAYIASGDPFDKAGGYAIQHASFAPVSRIEGSQTNVIGLPLETLREMLGE
ncbi:MAG: septum formation protein Maf [Anaerolineae bacterium]|nr:septum formation protein Maf [Anaerolineae bacterium]